MCTHEGGKTILEFVVMFCIDTKILEDVAY